MKICSSHILTFIAVRNYCSSENVIDPSYESGYHVVNFGMVTVGQKSFRVEGSFIKRQKLLYVL